MINYQTITLPLQSKTPSKLSIISNRLIDYKDNVILANIHCYTMKKEKP